MIEDIKHLIQTAEKVRQTLIQLRHARYIELLKQLTGLAERLRQLSSQANKMGTALSRGWPAAAESCCRTVDRLLGEIQYSISQVRQFTEAPQKAIPGLSCLVGELAQLRQEFGNIELDDENQNISVTTEPITLEDIYLGPFSIRLELSKLAELYRSTPYWVIAIEPNPAATDDSVTHPHVNGERLCEGDGNMTIRAALEEGRLCDFFTLVRSILRTYNPESPYISLSDWDGEPCYDCGYVMSPDNAYYCSFCEHTCCEECTTCCCDCDQITCLGCMTKCGSCEEPLCPSCARKSCTECETICCESCIDQGLCPDCKEEREAENERQEQQAQDKDKAIPSEKDAEKAQLQEPGIQEQRTHTEVHSHGLGQAAVFQG